MAEMPPIFRPAPMPGEAERPTHAYDLHTRAQLQSLHEKRNDDIANAVLKRMHKDAPKEPTSNPQGIQQVKTSKSIPVGPQPLVHTYSSPEAKAEAAALHEKITGEINSQRLDLEEKARAEREDILNKHTEHLQKHGPNRFRPSAPYPPVKNVTSNIDPKPGPLEKREAKARAQEQKEYLKIPQQKREEMVDKKWAKMKEAQRANKYKDVMAGTDIGDGKYIDPITRQTRRRQIGKAAVKTPHDVMEVARVIVGSHYNRTFEGQPINALTGETHPVFEKSPHYKKPIQYMRDTMGIEDPEKHIQENYSHALNSTEATPMEKSPPAKPFKSRNAEFMKTYLTNPLAAFNKEN